MHSAPGINRFSEVGRRALVGSCGQPSAPRGSDATVKTPLPSVDHSRVGLTIADDSHPNTPSATGGARENPRESPFTTKGDDPARVDHQTFAHDRIWLLPMSWDQNPHYLNGTEIQGITSPAQFLGWSSSSPNQAADRLLWSST